jgi:hypothetical protein
MSELANDKLGAIRVAQTPVAFKRSSPSASVVAGAADSLVNPAILSKSFVPKTLAFILPRSMVLELRLELI